LRSRRPPHSARTAWNHAIEAKDSKAIDRLLASTFIAFDIDGSLSRKGEFLASIKDPSYQPAKQLTRISAPKSTATRPSRWASFASEKRKKENAAPNGTVSLTPGSGTAGAGSVSPAKSL